MSVHIEEQRIVEQLSNGMMVKLAKNRHKTIWTEASIKGLLDFLDQEVAELAKAIHENHTKAEIYDECAEVANYAAMIADNVLHGTRGRR